MSHDAQARLFVGIIAATVYAIAGGNATFSKIYFGLCIVVMTLCFLVNAPVILVSIVILGIMSVFSNPLESNNFS